MNASAKAEYPRDYEANDDVSIQCSTS
jgi:hypothetical protein